jgi:hypothetical protein
MTPQYQIDPVTKKPVRHFGDKSILTVYVKHYNGRKKVVFMGTGDRAKEVIDHYNGLDIYLNDTKYLYHRMIDGVLDSEQKVLMQVGDKPNTRMETRLQSGRKKINYKFRDLSAVKHVPITIADGIDYYVNKDIIINAQTMTKTRLVSILFAEFLELTDEAKLNFLARGDLLLEQHKLACGGVSDERLQKQIASIRLRGEVQDGEDLL